MAPAVSQSGSTSLPSMPYTIVEHELTELDQISRSQLQPAGRVRMAVWEAFPLPMLSAGRSNGRGISSSITVCRASTAVLLRHGNHAAHSRFRLLPADRPRERSHRMNRRELMLLLGGTMTAPRSLRAQQKAMPVIGYLNSGSSV
jgi:hypothetical protein